MTAEFCPSGDVSRETCDRLELFEEALRMWSRRINLVSKGSLDQFSERHLHDSTQIFDLMPDGISHWLDIGSGGGLPGLVVAILAAEKRPELRVTLLEADKRKAAFLLATARSLGVAADVVADRIENTAPQAADVISARALAPLHKLLDYAKPHLKPDGVGLFLKGVNFGAEIEEARRVWDFEHDAIPSRTQHGAAVLRIPAPFDRRNGSLT